MKLNSKGSSHLVVPLMILLLVVSVGAVFRISNQSEAQSKQSVLGASTKSAKIPQSEFRTLRINKIAELNCYWPTGADSSKQDCRYAVTTKKSNDDLVVQASGGAGNCNAKSFTGTANFGKARKLKCRVTKDISYQVRLTVPGDFYFKCDNQNHCSRRAYSTTSINIYTRKSSSINLGTYGHIVKPPKNQVNSAPQG